MRFYTAWAKSGRSGKIRGRPEQPVKSVYQIGGDSVFDELKHRLIKTYTSNTLRPKPRKVYLQLKE